jgi:4-amino-4-deoxy-L-arabinose transferase-like glycosyltransferase
LHGEENSMKKLPFILALLLIALVGMGALLSATPYGLGLVNDTAYYIEGAANLLEGKGFVRLSGGGELKPITHFPPLFSLALAGLGLTGLDLQAGARLLITFLFGLDIFLVGLVIHKICRSTPFALLGALLLALSDVHLGVFSLALSEPLFITLMLGVFLCLAQSFESQKWGWFALTGFLLGLAYLTRYAGASLFITVLLSFVLLSRSPFRQSLFTLAGAALPILGWSLYNLSISQGEVLSNRQLAWHPVPIKTLFEAFKNLLTWAASSDILHLLPSAGRLLSLLSLLLIPGLLGWLAWITLRRLRSLAEQPVNERLALAFALALHIPVYLSFLVLSLSFFDASTPLNDRILSVIYLPELILFASGLAWAWQRLLQQKAFWRWGLGFFCALFLLFSIKDGLGAVQQLSVQGQGFAHQGWRESRTLQDIRALPDEITLYSNKPTAIYLLTGKASYIIPTPTDSVTGQTRPTYAADRALIQQRVLDGQAVLVLFGLKDSQEADEVALFQDLSADLPLLAEYSDGVIFGVVP